MKKIWSILLAALMLVSALPLGAFSLTVGAYEAPTIWVSSNGGYAGDLVTVSVSMENNPGLIGWQVTMDFDESVMELEGDPTVGDTFPASAVSFGPHKSPFNATFADAIHPDVTNSGVLYTVTFRIKEDAPVGVYPLEVYTRDTDNFFNSNWETVYFDYVGGSIEVYERVAGVALDRSALDLVAGDTAVLTPIFTPDTAYNKAVTWSTSDDSVASVSDDGTVTAHKYGTAVITVTTVDGGYTASATVNVACARHEYGGLTDGYCNACGTPRMVTRFDLTAPYTRVYALGDDTLDVDGGYVDIAYADGAEGRVALADAAVSGYDPAKLGFQTLTVSVGSGSAAYDVQVVEGDLPTIRVDAAQKAIIGKEFTATVYVENNPGLVSMKLSIDYDTTKLELTGVQQADAFADTSFGPLTNTPFIANWVDAIHPDNTTNGVFITLTFKVKDDAVVGPTPITVRYDADDLFNYDFEPVLFNVVNAEANVQNCIPGDVGNDGKVNVRDLGMLQQYLNGHEGLAIEMAAADVTGDGKVNVRDLGLLQQYLNGWDVELK